MDLDRNPHDQIIIDAFMRTIGMDRILTALIYHVRPYLNEDYNMKLHEHFMATIKDYRARYDNDSE